MNPAEIDFVPVWENNERPGFLQRTPTQYMKVPYAEVFTDRGLENRLLDSLCKYLPEGAWIGGGFLRDILTGADKTSADIDIFFNGPNALRETIKLIQEADDLDSDGWGWKAYKQSTDLSKVQHGAKEIRFIEYKHEQRPAIQLIKLVWYESPEHVIDTFDFTCAQFITDGKFVYMGPFSIMDLTRKRLVLHRMQFPESTLRRMLKYTAKGFYACPGSLTRIAQSIIDHGRVDSEFVYVD